ncbi:MAG TPA: hypothetical protein PK544_10815 [Spirochaetota bacterium]|nr:hypothetical protein [Spirochaetota bacterium]HPQ55055.1 hypothetical protein [Spirochaetota bacterium]
MPEYKAYSEMAEVNGETVLSIIDGMGAFRERALRFLSENGIVDPEPGKWYSQQAWLNAFRLIAGSTGIFTLFNIGKKIPEHAIFPPEIQTIDHALSAIDIAYHMNHRINGEVLFNPDTGEMKEGIGHYSFEKRSDNAVTMTCSNPYPCAFDKGIIEAMAYRFRPLDSFIIMISHDDQKECRSRGGECCTYNISW